jgi:hypothetical protein
MEEHLQHYSPEGIAEWKAAIEEYFRLEAESERQ